MELKDFIEFTGIEAEDLDTFKEKFESEFVRRTNAIADPEIISKVTGKAFGSVTTKLKQEAKKYGIELSGEEIKDKPFEEIVSASFLKFSEMMDEKVKAVVPADNTDALKEWQEKYVKLESKFKDTKSLLDNTVNDFTTFKETKESEFKGVKLNTMLNQVRSTVKLKQGVTELEKAGFETIIKSKYKFDIDESGELFVADSNGNRIKSDKKAGSFKTPEEVLFEEAALNKLVPENPHTKPVTAFAFGQKTETDTKPQAGRVLHPSAQR